MEGRKYRLVYFNIRGLAEPIRWMFKLKNIDFEDERIPIDMWKEEKERFSTQVGQLPILYVEDDRRKFELTQVHAVMRFVAKDLGFCGLTEMEMTRADEAAELIYDLRLCAVAHKECYTTMNPDIVRHTIFRDFRGEKSMSKKVLMRKRLMEQMPLYLERFVRFLDDSDGQYLAGPTITYADLALANFLDVLEDTINPDILNDYPTLKELKDEILNLPEVADWIEKSRPFYASAAA